MLVIRNQNYFDAVVQFAKENKLYESDPARPELQALGPALLQLERFIKTDADGNQVVRVALYPDLAPRSFGFSVERQTVEGWHEVLCGGLIFHGQHDNGGSGGAPTFSVSITPVVGWSIHT